MINNYLRQSSILINGLNYISSLNTQLDSLELLASIVF